jgi:hypothetical protein
MSPPNEVVLRRRHLVLVLLRVAAATLVIYGAISAARNAVIGVLAISGGALSPVSYVAEIIIPLLSVVAPGLMLAAASRLLARWLVPAGLRSDACPQCGYSLKQLKSPICPECGADVRGITRAGVREGATP